MHGYLDHLLCAITLLQPPARSACFNSGSPKLSRDYTPRKLRGYHCFLWPKVLLQCAEAARILASVVPNVSDSARCVQKTSMTLWSLQ